MAQGRKNTNITIQEFRKWNLAKQQQWINSSKSWRLPDAALPANKLAQRKAGQQARTEISPGSGVTFGDVARQSKYTEGLTFGEGDRQLADRAANAVTGREGSADWFKAYQQQVTGAADRAGAAVTAAGENNRGLFDSMNKLSQDDTARVQAAVRARAAELGQAAPDAGGLQGAQGAAATRAAMLGSAAITSNNEAATNAQFRNVGVNAAGLANNQNQADWNARDKAIAGDKTAYGEKKGLWRQKFLDDAINSARKGVLEDKVFNMNASTKSAAALLAQARADETARANRAREGISQQNADTSLYNAQKPPAAPKPTAPKPGWGAKGSNQFSFGAVEFAGLGVQERKTNGDGKVVKVNTPYTAKGIIIQTQSNANGSPFAIRQVTNRLIHESGGKLSKAMASRIIYSFIATNGNTSAMSLANAPKDWRSAVIAYNKLMKGK